MNLDSTFKEMVASKAILKMTIVKGKDAKVGDVLWTKESGYFIMKPEHSVTNETKVFKVLSIKIS